MTDISSKLQSGTPAPPMVLSNSVRTPRVGSSMISNPATRPSSANGNPSNYHSSSLTGAAVSISAFQPKSESPQGSSSSSSSSAAITALSLPTRIPLMQWRLDPAMAWPLLQQSSLMSGTQAASSRISGGGSTSSRGSRSRSSRERQSINQHSQSPPGFRDQSIGASIKLSSSDPGRHRAKPNQRIESSVSDSDEHQHQQQQNPEHSRHRRVKATQLTSNLRSALKRKLGEIASESNNSARSGRAMKEEKYPFPHIPLPTALDPSSAANAHGSGAPTPNSVAQPIPQVPPMFWNPSMMVPSPLGAMGLAGNTGAFGSRDNLPMPASLLPMHNALMAGASASSSAAAASAASASSEVTVPKTEPPSGDDSMNPRSMWGAYPWYPPFPNPLPPTGLLDPDSTVDMSGMLPPTVDGAADSLLGFHGLLPGLESSSTRAATATTLAEIPEVKPPARKKRATTSRRRNSNNHHNSNKSRLLDAASELDNVKGDGTIGYRMILAEPAHKDMLSCHQCKNKKKLKDVIICGHVFMVKSTMKTCSKKYCKSCLLRFYLESPVDDPSDPKWPEWKCPCCRYICCCAWCRKKKAKRLEHAAKSIRVNAHRLVPATSLARKLVSETGFDEEEEPGGLSHPSTNHDDKSLLQPVSQMAVPPSIGIPSANIQSTAPPFVPFIVPPPLNNDPSAAAAGVTSPPI